MHHIAFIYLFNTLSSAIGQGHIFTDQQILRKASEYHYNNVLNICPNQFVKSANALPANASNDSEKTPYCNVLLNLKYALLFSFAL